MVMYQWLEDGFLKVFVKCSGECHDDILIAKEVGLLTDRKLLGTWAQGKGLVAAN